MFYRLTHIDQQPLPISSTRDGRAVSFTGGGIVMQRARDPEPTPGYAMLRLFGSWTAEGGVHAHPTVMSSYRWIDDDSFDFVGPVEHRPAPLYIKGARKGAALTIELWADWGPFPAGTVFTFIEAPSDPMTAEWMRVTTRPAGQSPIPNEDPNDDWRTAWSDPA